MVLHNCSTTSPIVDTAVGTLLALECGLGLPGNAIALWTFFFRLKVWKPYAVYLFSLVVADLLLTACLPFHATFYLRHKAWGLGLASCQALLFLLALSRGVGVAFLAAVALDRYLRVVHPRLKVNLLPHRAAWGISVFIWLLLGALTYHSLLVSKPAWNATECHSFYPMAKTASITWQEGFLLLQLFLPFGLVVFCNSSILRTLRRRLREPDRQPQLQRAKVLVTVVLLLFALCFLPNMLASILVHILRGSGSCKVLSVVVHVADIAGSLTYLHSVLSPVLYCFSSRAFTHSYRKVLDSLRGRSKIARAPSLDKGSYS
ncbi:PREDICTED: 12-(S)-hydroxy-5,8,10,14-eicosatetraenoic acid receptor [Chinchilla lanigera]|uniref:12-(S)-hydroxy-5,8,10,14-eicosatetraenoic acid receptor n=1 Tax=Chinchilla lanigera TaxID=34839 RepID=UPI00038ECA40|nr:PREDICTED: 12-(S)-hydroxy-5,8,10,14-eicosatetraenoic acid receptor [Chinchilla lanigera]